MKKPPDPQPSAFSHLPLCHLQRPPLAAMDASDGFRLALCHLQRPLLATIDASDGLTSNCVASFSNSHHYIAIRDKLLILVVNQKPLKSTPFMRGKLASVNDDQLQNQVLFSGISSLACKFHFRSGMQFGAFQLTGWTAQYRVAIVNVSQNSHLCKPGCSKVPGCLALTRVAPGDGEQPYTGAPGCSSPCTRWSMMLSAISETYLLLLLLECWCLKPNGICVSWVCSMYVLLLNTKNGDRILNTEEYLIELVSMYVLFHVSIFFCRFEMFLTYCTHLMCFYTQFLLHGLRELIGMPCCAVTVKFIVTNLTNIMRTNSFLRWWRLSLIVHSLWLLFSRIIR